MVTPVTSEGSRSGVNWIREFVPCTVAASALASEVLPVPGKSSSSKCPSDSRQVTASEMVRGLPSTAWPMLPTSEENVWANHWAWSGVMVIFQAPESFWSPGQRIGMTAAAGRRAGHGHDTAGISVVPLRLKYAVAGPGRVVRGSRPVAGDGLVRPVLQGHLDVLARRVVAGGRARAGAGVTDGVAVLADGDRRVGRRARIGGPVPFSHGADMTGGVDGPDLHGVGVAAGQPTTRAGLSARAGPRVLGGTLVLIGEPTDAVAGRRIPGEVDRSLSRSRLAYVGHRLHRAVSLGGD